MSGELESSNVGVYLQYGPFQINPTIGTNGITTNFVLDGNAGVTSQVVATGSLNPFGENIFSGGIDYYVGVSVPPSYFARRKFLPVCFGRNGENETESQRIDNATDRASRGSTCGAQGATPRISWLRDSEWNMR